MCIRDRGKLKLIDFGFGKQTNTATEYDKSISLNWWCEPPNEFSENVYNFGTEVYFVGKLFQELIIEFEIDNFEYQNLLIQMCERDPTKRFTSFSEINQLINIKELSKLDFSDEEIHTYRTFSNSLYELVSNIDDKATYRDDISFIERRLNSVYEQSMLEEWIPSPQTISSAFIKGAYYYSRSYSFDVSTLKNFLSLIKNTTSNRKKIIFSNLRFKLESLPTYTEDAFDLDDEIPF